MRESLTNRMAHDIAIIDGGPSGLAVAQKQGAEAAGGFYA